MVCRRYPDDENQRTRMQRNIHHEDPGPQSKVEKREALRTTYCFMSLRGLENIKMQISVMPAWIAGIRFLGCVR